MITRVEEYIKTHELIQKGDRIVIGISGGADSVCLFHVLHSLKEQWDLSLILVHINHNIRQTAKRDEDFVKQLCEEKGDPIYVFSKSITEYAKERKISVEEAGREYRYQVFKEVFEKEKANKIAVAHHENDVAETFLFHSIRGTSLKGLGAIQPKNNEIVRPLLCLTKKEIEILWTLASNPGMVFSREHLLQSIWGYDFLGDTRAVDSHIKRIRAKLCQKENSWDIKTVWGVGYRFEIAE